MITIYGDYYADLAILSALKAFNIDAKWFLANKDRRLKECMLIKNCAQKLLYREKCYTFQHIGTLFNRCHGSIVNNVKKSTYLYDTDFNYKKKYLKAKEIFVNYLADSE